MLSYMFQTLQLRSLRSLSHNTNYCNANSSLLTEWAFGGKQYKIIRMKKKESVNIIEEKDMVKMSAQDIRRQAKANLKMVKFKGNGKNRNLLSDVHEVSEVDAKSFVSAKWGEIVK